MADVITPDTRTEEEANTTEEVTTNEAATQVASATPEPAVSAATPAEAAPAAAEAAPEAPSTPEPVTSVEQPEAPIPDAITSSDPAPVPEVAKASKPPKKTSKGMPKHLPRLIFEIFLVSVIIGLGVYCNSLKQDNAELKEQVTSFNSNPTIVALRDAQTLIKKVGTVVTLPTGEEPTIADVSDVNKAKTQSAFFNNAQNGDKVLLYVKGGTAILYRPSTGKVINQGPLNITSNTATPAKQ